MGMPGSSGVWAMEYCFAETGEPEFAYPVCGGPQYSSHGCLLVECWTVERPRTNSQGSKWSSTN